MAWQAWKAFEYRVAKSFGSRRNVLSGAWKGLTSADLIHEKLYIECKYRERIPFWMDVKTEVGIIGEDIWVVHKDVDAERAEKVRYKRKSFLEKIFREVVEAAKKEDKIPVLIVKSKRMQGWVMVVFSNNYTTVRECYDREKG